IRPMKKLFKLFVFLLCSFASLKSQKVYFIYLQTDNQQPFYARMGDKIYNSTPSGYLILSNLRDSSYSLKIGMQGSLVTDQPYSLIVNKKDQGFLLKNFGDKGWGLFNLTTMATIMPETRPVVPVQGVKTEKREDNAFTNLLAKVADDSTIKEKPIIEKPVEKSTETTALNTGKKEDAKSNPVDINPSKQDDIKTGKIVAPVVINEKPKTDSPVVKEQVQESNDAAKMKEDSIVAAKNKETEMLKQEELQKQDSISKAIAQANTEVEYIRSVVKLKSESSTTAGIGLVFLDMISGEEADTIRLLIPNDARITPPVQSKQEEKKFLDIASADSVSNETLTNATAKNNNCKAVAIEDDFYKLRKQMAAGKDDDDMIAEAKKTFKTKCFSTIQVRNLSTLFLSDESKYKFFDAAYQYVSDLENFATLQSTLKDEYYINRFKAMLRPY
ncbi:MAG TPA: DUF4476 domain-containing protein, partial [Chitinophagaceae bacterium]